MKQALLVLATALLLCGCATPKTPPSFSTINGPGWTTIEIREGVAFEKAWNTVIGILIRDFDLVVALRDEGYVRTDWLYSWSGKYQQTYRVRVTLKFSDDRKRIDLKPEAQSMQDGLWVLGVDTRLVSTLKTDLMGTIGRTTR